MQDCKEGEEGKDECNKELRRRITNIDNFKALGASRTRWYNTAINKIKQLGNRHTSPRESNAEIRNSIAPIRLSNIGSIVSSPCIALTDEVYEVTLRVFCKSEAHSIENPSRALKIICEIERDYSVN